MSQFSPKDQEFIDRAVEACQGMGEDAALLLYLFRLEMRLDRPHVSVHVRQNPYTGRTHRCATTTLMGIVSSGQLFVDRGDFEAHWTFYDTDDESGPELIERPI